MGADEDLDIAAFQRRELGPTLAPLVAPGEQFQHHARLFRQRLKPHKVLTGKDFRRRHQHRLAARFDRARRK